MRKDQLWKVFFKKLENFIATLFEDVRYERSLVYLISPTDDWILEKTGLRIMEKNYEIK